MVHRAVFALTFAIPWLGSLSAVFGFVPLSPGTLAAVVAILMGYIVATEVVKAGFFSTHAPRQPRPALPPN